MIWPETCSSVGMSGRDGAMHGEESQAEESNEI